MKKISSLLLIICSIVGFCVNVSAYGYSTISYDIEECYAIKNDNTLWKYEVESEECVKLLDNVKMVDKNYAVKTDNTLWTWGNSVFGEFSEPTMVMADVENISASWDYILVVKTDKSLWRVDIEPLYIVYDEEGNLRGRNSMGEYIDIDQREHKLMNNAEKAAAGAFHTVALKTDNTVWTFGANTEGQLGNGTKEVTKGRVNVMENAVDINAGGSASYALTEKDDLYMWGACAALILYTRDRKAFAEPIRHSFSPIIYADKAAQINPMLGVSVLLKQDGTVWIYGFTENEKQCDLEGLDIHFNTLPLKIAENVSNISTLYSGADFGTLLLKNDGDLYLAEIQIDANGVCQGYDFKKIMGNVKIAENLPAKEAVQFVDLPSSSDMKKAITHLANADIITGISKNEFAPDKAINRAETAAILLRMTGKGDETAITHFTDVPTDSWYYGIAGAAQKYGIIDGYEDNTFRGEEAVSDLQLAVLAARTLKNEGTAIEPYPEPSITLPDNIPDWAADDISYAIKYGILTEEEAGKLSDTKGMTRGEAAVILYRLYCAI